jgi:hypothetical protein
MVDDHEARLGDMAGTLIEALKADKSVPRELENFLIVGVSLVCDALRDVHRMAEAQERIADALEKQNVLTEMILKAQTQ